MCFSTSVSFGFFSCLFFAFSFSVNIGVDSAGSTVIYDVSVFDKDSASISTLNEYILQVVASGGTPPELSFSIAGAHSASHPTYLQGSSLITVTLISDQPLLDGPRLFVDFSGVVHTVACSGVRGTEYLRRFQCNFSINELFSVAQSEEGTAHLEADMFANAFAVPGEATSLGSLVIDNTAPHATIVLSSAVGTQLTYADLFSVSLTSDEPLLSAVLSFANWNSVHMTSVSPTSWSYDLTMPFAFPEGPIEYTLTITDYAGNTGTYTQAAATLFSYSLACSLTEGEVVSGDDKVSFATCDNPNYAASCGIVVAGGVDPDGTYTNGPTGCIAQSARDTMIFAQANCCPLPYADNCFMRHQASIDVTLDANITFSVDCGTGYVALGCTAMSSWHTLYGAWPLPSLGSCEAKTGQAIVDNRFGLSLEARCCPQSLFSSCTRLASAPAVGEATVTCPAGFKLYGCSYSLEASGTLQGSYIEAGVCHALSSSRTATVTAYAHCCQI